MNAPAVIIVFELEQTVRVYYDTATDGQKSRLDDWLQANPDYAQLVSDAIELASPERAA